jgi:DNA-binding NarL/FixJ family response regulator
MLREYLRWHATDGFPSDLETRMGEVITMLPEIDRVLRGRAVPEIPPSATTAFSLFDAITQVLRRASEEDPLLLVLDRLQQADVASLGLLEHVASDLWGSRVMCLVLAHPLTSRSPAPLRAAMNTAAAARGALRLELRVESQREEPNAGTLSSREGQVAGLVAGGLTNRKIADALFISERTAEYHVQNIMNKLGFNARSQIAAWHERSEK